MIDTSDSTSEPRTPKKILSVGSPEFSASFLTNTVTSKELKPKQKDQWNFSQENQISSQQSSGKSKHKPQEAGLDKQNKPKALVTSSGSFQNTSNKGSNQDNSKVLRQSQPKPTTQSTLPDSKAQASSKPKESSLSSQKPPQNTPSQENKNQTIKNDKKPSTTHHIQNAWARPLKNIRKQLAGSFPVRIEAPPTKKIFREDTDEQKANSPEDKEPVSRKVTPFPTLS